MKASSQQRDDIQWLRALAVISVIFFHLWPSSFPYGYLGVDIFFVISGYLMTSIISKSELNLFTIKTFYLRRIKRIFPMCLSVILVTCLIGKFYLLPDYFDDLLTEGIWAIIFGTNVQPIITQANYFDLLAEYKFLLHTWSLGVEIQFYLIVPFVFYFIESFHERRLIPVFSMIFLSYGFQTFYASEIVAFNFLLSRIWQFLCGSVAFYCLKIEGSSSSYIQLSKIENDELDTKMLTSIFNWQIYIPFLAAIVLFPFSVDTVIPSFVVRTTATCIAALTVSVPQNLEMSSFTNFISNGIVYVGDASYALYLTHWPIIIFAKYFNYIQNFSCSFVLLILIFAVAVILHEAVEKPLRKYSTFVNVSLILSLYLCILYLYVFSSQESVLSNFDFNPDKNATLAEKIKANQKIRKHSFGRYECINENLIPDICVKKVSWLTWYCCAHEFLPNSTSPKTAVILGNSYGGEHYAGISEALQQLKFTKVFALVRSACLPHGGELNKEYEKLQCQNWMGHPFDQFLKAVKPDIIFITARLTMFKSMMSELPTGDLMKTDLATQELSKYINAFSKLTKKLIIIAPNPDIDFSQLKAEPKTGRELKRIANTTYSSALSVAKSLHMGESLTKYVLPIQYVYGITHAPEVRILTAMQGCPNCIYFNTTQIFCNKNGCPLYDEKTDLAFLRDQAHITTVASYKLTKPIMDAILHSN